MIEETMAQAVFHREFNWHRPNSKFSFNAQASEDPQSRVHDFVDAAVKAGAATRVKPARKSADNIEETTTD